MSQQQPTPAQPGSLNELVGDPDALRVRSTVPCSIKRAWDFVTVPGWFVNDGELRDHVLTTPETGRHVVQDPVHGEFLFEDLDVVPPTQYVFRGSHTGGETRAPATVVTFSLRELTPPDRGTEIVVTETGFSGLGLAADACRAAIDENVRAWVLELKLAAHALR